MAGKIPITSNRARQARRNDRAMWLLRIVQDNARSAGGPFYSGLTEMLAAVRELEHAEALAEWAAVQKEREQQAEHKRIQDARVDRFLGIADMAIMAQEDGDLPFPDGPTLKRILINVDHAAALRMNAGK